MDKVFFAGTHRVRPPQETLDLITPLLPAYGVTRLADVTGLDVIGIPVVMAVRPLATTLTVFQGKGADLLAAKVSGAMEAIEVWHAENAVPAPDVLDAPAAELDLGYRVTDLDHQGSLLTEKTRLDWIPARTAVTDRQVLVPRASVQMGWRPRDDWRNYLLTQSSNGLASGNTRSEAVIHALYEAIERDATSEVAHLPADRRVYLDPDTVDDEYCRGLIELIRRAKAWLEVVYVPNRWGLPCFVAYLWHEDLAACLATGAGVHSDPAVAFSRAVTEAAQSRLTLISATRDDLDPSVYRLSETASDHPSTPGRPIGWQQVLSGCSAPRFGTDDAEADWLAERVTEFGGCEPMVVRLAEREELAVVKVLCPGLRFDGRHNIPRLEAENVPAEAAR